METLTKISENIPRRQSIADDVRGGKTLPAVSVLQQKNVEDRELAAQGKFIVQKQGMAEEELLQKKGNEEDLPTQGKFIVQKAGMVGEEPLQKKGNEEELPVQGKFVVQKTGMAEEETLQKKGDEEELPAQGKFVVQKMGMAEEETLQKKGNEEDLPSQGKFVVQKASQGVHTGTSGPSNPIQRKENKTGLPDNLKSGIENISGMDLGDVKVHYNSAKPAQLNALAYAQGTDIHVAPGQEKHLPHEAWHVVQQKQGRVKATMQMKGGVPVNDDKGLEHEADVMGAKALKATDAQTGDRHVGNYGSTQTPVVQNQAAIDVRQGQIDGLQTALDGIPAGGANATPAEIALHDNAISAGQHHGNRAVGRNALRADLQGRIDTLETYQTRDNLRLPALAGVRAVQLFREQGKPPEDASLPGSVVQGNFEEDYEDIRDNNPLLGPGMHMMQAGARAGMAGAGGVARAAEFAAGPATWAARGIKGADSRWRQAGYMTGGIVGSVVTGTVGLIGGGIAAGLGTAGAAIAGGAGLATTALGGLAQGAISGGSAAVSAVRNFSLDHARGIYPATATHPVYGDQGMRQPLPPPAVAPAMPAFPMLPGADPLRASAPIPIPGRRGVSERPDFMPGAPPTGGVFGAARMDRRLIAPVSDEDAMPLSAGPVRGYGSLNGSGLSEPLLNNLPEASHVGAPAGMGGLLLDGDGDFDAPMNAPSALSRAIARRRPAPPPPVPLPAVVPAAAPAVYAPEHGEYNADGSRKNYGMERKRDLAQYGVLGSGVAASAAGRVAWLHGAVDTSALSATTPWVEGAGGAAGIVGAIGDLAESAGAMRGAADSSRQGRSRMLSGVHAASALASATKSSATAAWNLGSLANASTAVTAGAQVAAGGAAIATGTLDIGRGIYGAKVAHERMNAIGAVADSADATVRNAAEVAGASQERERTRGVATALKGGMALAGGIMLAASMATPVGWILLGGAAVIGGIAALYNYKKKKEMKEKVTIDALGIRDAKDQWDTEVNRAKAHTTWGTSRRKDALARCGADPLVTALSTHGFTDVGHFYGNYINYTANYLFQEGVAGAANADAAQLITSMGLVINRGTGQPTPEKIAKHLSI